MSRRRGKRRQAENSKVGPGNPDRPGEAASSGERRRPAPSRADVHEVERLLVRYQLTIRRRLPVLLLSLISGLALSLCFEPFALWWLACVALVPWTTAIATAARWWWMLFCSWLTGFLFFAVNLHWLLACGYPGPVGDVALMVLAQLALSAYQGLYFLLFAYVVGGLVRRWGSAGQTGAGRSPTTATLPSGLLMTYIVPIAWVGTEVLRGYVLTGFPWFLLGYSLAAQTTLIQIADLAGVYAVSFLLAAANGLVADGLLQPLFLPTRKGPRPNYQVSAATLALLGLILLAVVYGRYRVAEYDASERPGPRVGVIQHYVPISLAPIDDHEALLRENRQRLADHLALSAAAAAAKPTPELIGWPETMVPEPVNDEFLAIVWGPPADKAARQFYADLIARTSDHIKLARQMDHQIRRQAVRFDVPLLIGAASIVPVPAGWTERGPVNILGFYREPIGQPTLANRQLVRYNSAILYQPIRQSGASTAGADVVKTRYDKRHLVPFSELLPFRRSWPAAFRLLRKLTPMSLLEPGTGPRQLTFTTRAGERYRFAAPICYEDVMPQAIRPLVYDPDGTKRADFLVNISNDGWFAGTTELAQHWNVAIFRCVENRVPMARSVNCGCSGFIDSLGRPMGRLEPGVKGHLAAVLPLDTRVTLYSHIGDAPGWVCVAVLFAGWVVVLIRRRRAKRGAKSPR